MISRKNTILSLVSVGIIALQFPVFADDISDMKAVVTGTMAKLVQKYEARIQELEAENSRLKQELATLKGTGATLANAVTTSTGTTPIITSTMTKADIYSAVMKRANDQLGTILSENNLSTGSVIGLFEFMEPNAVFISLDDGNNPADVLAFKTKILYTFDNNLAFTRVGLFDLNYASQKYRTLFGSNTYTKAVRTRMENPSYKGQLLKIAASNMGSALKIPTSLTGGLATSEVTLSQIKTAYDKNKLLDALKLSDVYIVKNPNDIEVLRIRYRSYYMVGKYDNSLSEIKKIETIQGTAFERTIACDASVIGKITKKTDVSSYYSAICKKK